jgi:hypothetical protein
MSKYFQPRFCQLQDCEEEIPLERHGNSEYCCDFHRDLGKSVYNATYYKRNAEYTKAIAANEFALKRLGDTFGYEISFDANMTKPLLFNWNLIIKRVKRGDLVINVVGSLGYVLFENSTMKIYKI